MSKFHGPCYCYEKSEPTTYRCIGMHEKYFKMMTDMIKPFLVIVSCTDNLSGVTKVWFVFLSVTSISGAIIPRLHSCPWENGTATTNLYIIDTWPICSKNYCQWVIQQSQSIRKNILKDGNSSYCNHTPRERGAKISWPKLPLWQIGTRYIIVIVCIRKWKKYKQTCSNHSRKAFHALVICLG